jgi:purine-binding chemotaxis protein CheW
MTDRKMPPPQQPVAEPDTALVNYLDTLLAEIDGQAPPAVAEPAVKAIPDRADTLQESAATAATELAKTTSDDATKRTPPAWAATSFQVLLFVVGGVRLAVPLSELLGILPLQGSISRLPGQPHWAIGVVRNRDEKVVVVDTRRLLMPQSPPPEQVPAYSHILLIGDGGRGLAVNALDGTEMLESEAVRWRSREHRHPWYAGIINDKLTAVVDVDGIMRMLAA